MQHKMYWCQSRHKNEYILFTDTEDETLSVGHCAAIMCPVIMLQGKLASKNARLQKDHIASCTNKFVQKYFLSLNSKVMLMCLYFFYTYIKLMTVPSFHPVVQADNVPSSYCVTVMVQLLHSGPLKLSHCLSHHPGIF